MRDSAARPARKTPRTSEQARVPNSASAFFEPTRTVWTKELERRRQAVNRWRGIDQGCSHREERGAD